MEVSHAYHVVTHSLHSNVNVLVSLASLYDQLPEADVMMIEVMKLGVYIKSRGRVF